MFILFILISNRQHKTQALRIKTRILIPTVEFFKWKWFRWMPDNSLSEWWLPFKITKSSKLSEFVFGEKMKKDVCEKISLPKNELIEITFIEKTYYENFMSYLTIEKWWEMSKLLKSPWCFLWWYFLLYTLLFQIISLLSTQTVLVFFKPHN